jgi:hypothetical protein
MNHCKPITKMPEQAQTTSFVLLKQYAEAKTTRIVSAQRSKPWEIYW